MNHFRLRHCPVLYMDVLEQEEINKIIDDHASEDFKDILDRNKIKELKEFL